MPNPFSPLTVLLAGDSLFTEYQGQFKLLLTASSAGEELAMEHLFAAKKQSSVPMGQIPETKEPISETTEQTSESVDEHTMDELLAACEGAVCEVFSMDNYLFFAGHVAQRDPDFKMVTIEPRQNSEAPLGVGHGTPVKVQVRVRAQWGNLVMLYGVVSVCEEERWNIFVQNAMACTESRKAFRQRVQGEAQLLWGPGFRFRGKCQLEDISLVGVAFYSPLKLEVGRQLILSIPFLTENGPSYQLACTIATNRNTAQPNQPPNWRYGCAFDPLEEEVEGLLYKDIITLQLQGRNA